MSQQCRKSSKKSNRTRSAVPVVAPTQQQHHSVLSVAAATASKALATIINPNAIKGSDDMGNYFNSQSELMTFQQANRLSWYAVNAEWWISGYGGKTDDEAMIGDGGGLEDANEGLAFLDRWLLLLQERNTLPILPINNNSNNNNSSSSSSRAVDVGAGVGRIAKHILLKRYDRVYLLEGDSGWSKRSRVYLGKKRAAKCTFGCIRLEDLKTADILSWTGETGADVIWLQWTLQYLTDHDAISLLKHLAQGLAVKTGILIVKENRPYGMARRDRFQMDTPAGNGRYDITRTDEHHRLLLQQAGLTIHMTEQGDETNTYAVS